MSRGSLGRGSVSAARGSVLSGGAAAGRDAAAPEGMPTHSRQSGAPRPAGGERTGGLLTALDGSLPEVLQTQHARFGSAPAGMREASDVFRLTEVSGEGGAGGGGGGGGDGKRSGGAGGGGRSGGGGGARIALGAHRAQTAAEKLAVTSRLVQKRLLKGTIDGVSELQLRLRVPGITASVFRDVLQLKVCGAARRAADVWFWW